MKKRLAALALTVCASSVSMAQASTMLHSISSYESYQKFASNYYVKPRQDLINEALRFISNSEALRNPDLQHGILMSFSCIFNRYDPTRKRQWFRTINRLDDYSSPRLISAVKKKPDYILSKVALSPKKNDMHWSCFFASGDKKYIFAVIYSLSFIDERENMQRYMTALTAKWSLTTYARRHEPVRKAILSLQDDPDEMLRQQAYEILNQSPDEILQLGLSVVKQQKDLGIW